MFTSDYNIVLARPETLDPRHWDSLVQSSGVNPQVVLARGYKTVTTREELRALGFSSEQCRAVPGLLLPVHAPDGTRPFSVYRPDRPRIKQGKHRPDGTRKQKEVKYEFPRGQSMRLDCPPLCRPGLADPRGPLYFTEGQKKADALASHGACAVALLGVWNFKGANDLGGVTLLADFDYIALKGRDVWIVFDSDITSKREVRAALARLTEHLQRKGAHVGAVYLPPGPQGEKVGVDDYLLGHSLADLERLAEGPRLAPKAASPTVKLLDVAPDELRRPIALIGEQSYVATWLWVEETKTECLNEAGEVVKLDPPQVAVTRRLFVIRKDGRVFGEGGDASLEELGLEVCLPEPPPENRLWTAPGVKGYRAEGRPQPAEVFGRVTEVVDRFMDFDRSLASQRTMAELVACYIIGTYFLDAFKVVGYLWPTGDRGSGKTHLLTIICELAYLGLVILAGGSYASLRDLADYGATLAFDDAELATDPKRGDPDKRTLLLAGNRRGSVATVKEQAGDKTWRTRYINTFCPRLFSAIRLPDPVLGSRTIVIPLVRTSEKDKANADPLDYSLWPHDRRKLIDDLWALALADLPQMPHFDSEAAAQARLSGRDLEPWRTILAVALWLEGQGVEGLFEAMEELAFGYQSERPSLETTDLTRLVIQALLSLYEKPGDLTFTTATLTERVNCLAEEKDLADEGVAFTNPRRVGKVLQRLRLRRPSHHGQQRGWTINDALRENLVKAYGFSRTSTHMSQAHVPTLRTCPKKDMPQAGLMGHVGHVGTGGTFGRETPSGKKSTKDDPYFTSVPDAAMGHVGTCVKNGRERDDDENILIKSKKDDLSGLSIKDPLFTHVPNVPHVPHVPTQVGDLSDLETLLQSGEARKLSPVQLSPAEKVIDAEAFLRAGLKQAKDPDPRLSEPARKRLEAFRRALKDMAPSSHPGSKGDGGKETVGYVQAPEGPSLQEPPAAAPPEEDSYAETQQAVLRAGARLGWQAWGLSQDHYIPSGEQAWEAFAQRAPVYLVEAASAMLAAGRGYPHPPCQRCGGTRYWQAYRSYPWWCLTCDPPGSGGLPDAHLVWPRLEA